ncbi:unnamed protein product [Bursaphelenchus okinawaensis]|uniref:Uncharacterized protein n=1 Tax=Bursaphelenchus okinawaensis TaxID=465554 RepID=A0A811KGL5_9BILA|nr:unnamed protein product [Bursaphelenchus okinawaensis]CAG9101876.1 unnamed protein product [Bursaphelenchus okinawaensis]
MPQRSLLFITLAILIDKSLSYGKKPFAYNETDVNRNYEQVRKEINTSSWDVILILMIISVIIVIIACVWDSCRKRPKDTDSLRRDSLTLRPPEKIRHKLTVCALPDGADFTVPIVTIQDEIESDTESDGH